MLGVTDANLRSAVSAFSHAIPRDHGPDSGWRLVERGRRQTREKTHPARLKAAAASSDTFLTEGADSPRASSQRRAARDGRQAERERQQAERRARLRAPASSRSAPTFNHRER